MEEELAELRKQNEEYLKNLTDLRATVAQGEEDREKYKLLTQQTSEQRLLDSLSSAVPFRLDGSEDVHSRQKWANMMATKLRLWPFGKTKIGDLFDLTLSGEAWKAYNAMQQGANESEKEFALRIVEQFKRPQSLEPLEISEYMDQCQLKKIRTVEALEREFTILQGKVDRMAIGDTSTKALLLNCFTKMLPRSIQQILMAVPNVTAENVLEIAKRILQQDNAFKNEQVSKVDEVLALLADRSNDRDPPSRSSEVADKSGQLELQMAQQSKDFATLSANLEAVTKSLQELQTQSRDSQPRGRGRSRTNRVNAMQDSERMKLYCDHCHIHGHDRARCWKANPQLKPSQAMASAVVCQLCNGHGHDARSCTKKTNNVQPRSNVVCFNCNETGHYQSACPKPPRQKNRTRNPQVTFQLPAWPQHPPPNQSMPQPWPQQQANQYPNPYMFPYMYPPPPRPEN